MPKQTSHQAPQPALGSTADPAKPNGPPKDSDVVSEAAAAIDKAKPVRSGPKVGRNDPCPCRSGKKFKHCCGKNG